MYAFGLGMCVRRLCPLLELGLGLWALLLLFLSASVIHVQTNHATVALCTCLSSCLDTSDVRRLLIGLGVGIGLLEGWGTEPWK